MLAVGKEVFDSSAISRRIVHVFSVSYAMDMHNERNKSNVTDLPTPTWRQCREFQICNSESLLRSGLKGKCAGQLLGKGEVVFRIELKGCQFCLVGSGWHGLASKEHFK